LSKLAPLVENALSLLISYYPGPGTLTMYLVFYDGVFNPNEKLKLALFVTDGVYYPGPGTIL
jgi:hypothetical protein